jgi:hypothetical protein
MKIEPKLPPNSKVGNSALKILLLLVLKSWLRAFMNIPAKKREDGPYTYLPKEIMPNFTCNSVPL